MWFESRKYDLYTDRLRTSTTFSCQITIDPMVVDSHTTILWHSWRSHMWPLIIVHISHLWLIPSSPPHPPPPAPNRSVTADEIQHTRRGRHQRRMVERLCANDVRAEIGSICWFIFCLLRLKLRAASRFRGHLWCGRREYSFMCCDCACTTFPRPTIKYFVRFDRLQLQFITVVLICYMVPEQ